MSRTVAVVTTSRADYGHLYWPLVELRDRPTVEVRLIAMGAHLSPEFGRTVDAIEADGFEVDERVECLLSSDTDVGMAKTIGLATLSLADALDRLRPDLTLLIADRYELLAPASAALALRIPIAHVEGGEVSEGAIDHAVRNALTMMSHVHFTPTESAQARVLAMGEEEWRVHRVGAPSLDHLRRSRLLERAEVESRLGIGLDSPPLIVAYHPVTLAYETVGEADAVYRALEVLRGPTGGSPGDAAPGPTDAFDARRAPIVFCFPNADAGSRELIRRARAFCEAAADAHVFVNLEPALYWSLLRCAGLMLGNSSSAIMEAPALRLPVVNVGIRQQGRERAANIVDADARAETILAAVERAASASFRESLADMVNPYGDGHAAERIAEVIASVPLGEELLRKRARPPAGPGEGP